MLNCGYKQFIPLHLEVYGHMKS